MLLGGSCVVISRHISRITTVMSYIRGLITPLITTHEPPSVLCAFCVCCFVCLGIRVLGLGFRVWGLGFRI